MFWSWPLETQRSRESSPPKKFDQSSRSPKVMSRLKVGASHCHASRGRLVAYFVPSDNDYTVAGLRDHLKAKLPAYAIPSGLFPCPR